MKINNWWADDPAEVYWMEITDRPDLGADLRAPKLDRNGRDNWSYLLTTYVQPGDRVFHWDRDRPGEPAIVAWSEAVGPLQTIHMPWQPRGATARAAGWESSAPREAWSMPLRNLTPLPQAITRSDVNARFEEIRDLLAEVERQAGGSAYAPFQNYGGRDLRAQQGYLTKFPAALAALLFEATPPRADSSRLITPRQGRRQGYLSDAVLRAALERHAVRLAREFYEDAGATLIEELGKPYDLRVVLNGVERHVEVKGSSGTGIESIQLTQGEVDHAEVWGATDLFVVDGIVSAFADDGSVATSGGVARRWQDWTPASSALRPTHLRYVLPPHGGE